MADRFAPFRLGRYECTQLIGMGGMASVYRARLKTVAGFQKDYALKKIYQHLAEQPKFLEMFIREASISARLDHGNIARMLELNEESGQYYMVLEYVDGVTLRQLLDVLTDQGKAMPWHMACYVAMETAKALHYAHTTTADDGTPLGLVHRDLSPSNIMLSRRGQVKVLDFGIAKALLLPGTKRSTELKGKYEYMSPEQVRGEVLDCRSDIFSLGIVLYEMLSGKSLFDASSIPGILAKVQQAKVPPLPDVEPLLEPVLHRMMSADPSQRYSSAEEVRSILAQILLVRGRLVGETHLAAFLAQALRKPTPKPAGLGTGGEYGEPTTPERNSGGWSGRDEETEEETIPRDRPSEEVDSMIATRQIFPKLSVVDDNEDIEDLEDATSTGVQASVMEAGKSLSPSLLQIDSRRSSKATPDKLPPTPVSMTPPPRIQIPPLEVVSNSEPEYALSPEHFSPKLNTMQVPSEDPPEQWTSRHVLILVLAILSMVIAGSAVYLAFSRSKTEQEPPASTKIRRHRTTNKSQRARRPRPGMSTHRQASSGAPVVSHPSKQGIRETRKVSEISTRPQPQTRVAGAMARSAEPSPRKDAGTHAEASDGPTVVPMRGRRTKNDIDVVTVPKGANVLCDRKRMGKTPLRLRLQAGQTCDLILNLPRHRIVDRHLGAKRWGGKRFKQYLPMISRPPKIARSGTSVDTKCQGPAIYRIFLNGRDTGHNCPARIRIPPGINDISIHLTRNRRLFYKKFRVRGGKTEIVEWVDTP